MAETMPPIVIELQAKTDELKAALADVQSRIKDLGGTAASAQAPVEGVSSRLKDLAKAAVEAFAVAEVVRYLVEASKVAGENAASFAVMAQTLHNVTGATKEQTDAVDKQIEAMALATGHVAADLRPAFEKLVAVTKDSTQATKMLGLAQDLAATKHIDVTTASQALAKAYSGQTTALTRLAPEVKNTKDKFAALAQETKGAAVAAADANPWQKLQATFESIKERIGAGLLPVINLLNGVWMAMMPLIDQVSRFIAKLVKAFQPFIAQLMADLIPLVGQLMGIFMNVAQVALPMVVGALNILMPIVNAVSPIIILVTQAVNFLVSAFAKFADILVNAVGSAIKAFLNQFGPLGKAIEGFFGWLGKLANIKPIKLSFDTSMPKLSATDLSAWDLSSQTAGGTKVAAGTGTSAAAKALEKHKAAVAKFTQIMKDEQTKALAAEAEYNSKATAAQEAFANKVEDITTTFNDAMSAATAQRDADMESLQKSHADNLLQIQADFSAKLNDIVQQSMNLMRDAFAQATSIDVGSMFASSLTTSTLATAVTTQIKDGLTTVVSWWGSASSGSGGGVAGLLKSMQDKLSASKQLSDNAGKLAGAGFSQTFIDQVISQGTDVGNQMASAILDAAPETQKALQSTFAEAEAFTQHGVDSLASNLYQTQGLATESLKNLYAQTMADQAAALEKENESFLAAQNKIMDAYNAAVTKATEARDKALKAAQDALDAAMASAEASLNKTLDAISAKIDATIAKMGNLNPNAASAAKAAVVNATVGTFSSPAPSSIGSTPSAMQASINAAAGLTINNNIQTTSNVSATDLATSITNASKLSMPLLYTGVIK